MYPRYSKSSPGRLSAFKATSVPRANKGHLPPSVWNLQGSRAPKSNPPPQTVTSRSYFVSGTSAVQQKTRQSGSKSREGSNFLQNRQRSKSANERRPPRVVHFTSTDPEDNEEEEALAEYLISRKPSAVYRYNSVQFLNSLRKYRPTSSRTVHHRQQETTSLSQHYRMSKDILDSFVRVKTAQIEGLFGAKQQSTNGFESGNLLKLQGQVEVEGANNNTSHNSNTLQEDSPPPSANHSNESDMKRRSTAVRSSTARAKSASQSSRGSASRLSTSTCKVNRASDDDDEQQRRSLEQISSIANWERQIRYELEIEKELQRRELDRQREKLASDQRKLADWDKALRIELDARERKIRLSEEELRSRCEDFSAQSAELMRREQIISDIVAERIKAEMRHEIEKLRKKFNELETDKASLAKKEERVKEVEARLHEQVKIVKEKIDSKRLTDIELARYKKELEIVKKENEVLKERVDSMEDYQVTRFENRAMKGELAMLRESLDSRTGELERERERWEREERTSNQKLVALKGDLRRAEQELVIARQKAEGDLEEASSKYDAVSGQLKRLQAFVKEHIAKLNSDFSSAAASLNVHCACVYPGGKQRIGRHPARGASVSHQRSVSMDGHEYLAASKGTSFLNSTIGSFAHHHRTARGCRLCNTEEEHICEQLEADHLLLEEEDAQGALQEDKVVKNYGEENEQKEDVFQKIADKVYEKMSSASQQLSSDNLMSQLLSSLSKRELSTSNLPNYHESTRIEEEDNLPSSGQEPSLFDEIQESEKRRVAGTSNLSFIAQSASTGAASTSFSGVSVLPEASELENDDNNNRVLSKKPSSLEEVVLPESTLAPSANLSTTVPSKEKAPVSRSNSAGDSKSDSFEIDW